MTRTNVRERLKKCTKAERCARELDSRTCEMSIGGSEKITDFLAAFLYSQLLCHCNQTHWANLA